MAGIRDGYMTEWFLSFSCFFLGEPNMNPGEIDIDLAQLVDERFPVPDGVKVPRARFSKKLPPEPQALPALGPKNCGALTQDEQPRLEWIDKDLGISVFIKYKGDEVWAFVQGNDASLAGKSASVALVGETSHRFLSRLIPLECGAGGLWTGEHCFGPINEVHRQLESEKITLDVYLME
jgi:hypothetical protein